MAFAGSIAIAWYRFRSPAPGGDRLESLTKDELYDRARAAEIPGRSEMSKEELVRALRSLSG